MRIKSLKRTVRNNLVIPNSFGLMIYLNYDFRHHKTGTVIIPARTLEDLKDPLLIMITLKSIITKFRTTRNEISPRWSNWNISNTSKNYSKVPGYNEYIVPYLDFDETRGIDRFRAIKWDKNLVEHPLTWSLSKVDKQAIELTTELYAGDWVGTDI